MQIASKGVASRSNTRKAADVEFREGRQRRRYEIKRTIGRAEVALVRGHEGSQV